jgi:GNAT superfamily N-acetyltransferase
VVAAVPITHPDAQLLIEEVQAEYVVRYGTPDETPFDPAEFEAPRGAFFVVYDRGRPVATGAWRWREDVEAFGSRLTAEVKRMFVTASHRGQGLARFVLDHLERTALVAGAQVMILETGTAQPEAIGLYVASGYTPIAGFGHYAWSPLNRCFAKPLEPLPQ